MFRNYLVTALENLKKHKFSAIINIFGLAVCLGCFVVIALFIRYELSYDSHHEDHERIFRLTETIDADSYVENSSSAPFPVLPALITSYPDLIESGVRLFDMQLPIKSIRLEDDRKFNERGIFFADSNLFQFFNMPLIYGKAEEVLSRPKTVVLSEKLAAKYFGNEDPVGKILFLGGHEKMDLEVTGVFKSGGPTHIKPEAVISFSTYLGINRGIERNWVWNPCWSYIRLAPGVKPEDLSDRFPDFVQLHYIERLKTMVTHQLQPLSSIHLHSDLEFEMGPNGNMQYIYILSSAALFLLIVGCINYVNLTTLGFFGRTRELAIRRVLGASPSQIRFQILAESVVLTLISGLLGFGLIALFLPGISEKMQLDLRMDDLMHLPSLAMTSVFLLFIGLLAGLYPALRFSNIETLPALRGELSSGSANSWFRNSLVILQFSLSIILIIFSLSARRQLHYLNSKEAGFASENVLLFKITGTQIPGKLKSFRQELMKHPMVKGVTVMNEILGVNNNNHEFNYEGLPRDQWHYFPALMVDEEFTKVFDMKLIAGRHYDGQKAREDSTSIIVNESMTRFLGFTDPLDAIDKRMQSLSGQEKIVGVVEDFHFKSLHHPIGPMVLDIEHKRGNFYYFAKLAVIRVEQLNPDVLDHMEGVWKSLVNHHPFDYRMLDTEISSLYKGEQRLTILLDAFTLISVLVALLGLFALSRFMAHFKKREMAIRKVFGAEYLKLIILAGRQQLMLLLLAFCIALPTAYMSVNYWLKSFSYRIDQSFDIYGLATTAALLLSIATVVLVAIRTLRANPAEVLQYE